MMLIRIKKMMSCKTYNHHLRRILLILVGVPRLLLCLFQNMLCPLVYVFWYFLLQFYRKTNSELFWKVEGMIYESFAIIIGSWIDSAGHTVYECGDDISKISSDEALVMMNHQSPNDIITMMRSFQGRRWIYGHAFWIMDWIFQFLHIGWVSKGHGDFFLLQAPDAAKFSRLLRDGPDKAKLKQPSLLRDKILCNFLNRNRKWIILFPEGGFVSKRRNGSQRYAKKNGFPILQHVALPRLGAVQTIVDTLGVAPSNQLKINCSADTPSNTSYLHQLHGGFCESTAHRPKPLKWVVDVTIGYMKQNSMLEYISGHNGSTRTVLYYRVFPAHELVPSETKLTEHESNKHLENWMFNLFVEKEKLLSYFYVYNNFPKLKTLPEELNCIRYHNLHIPAMIFIQIMVALQAFGIAYSILRFWRFFI